MWLLLLKFHGRGERQITFLASPAVVFESSLDEVSFYLKAQKKISLK